MTHESNLPTIAILGGGLSGAVVAYQLALASAPARIVVVEPRAELGRGLAYSALDPAHRLNVPATKMTIRTDQMDHFSRWLTGPDAPALPPDSLTQAGDIFAPRHIFGTYVAAQIAPFLTTGRIAHRKQVAVAVSKDGGQHRITLSDGSVLVAEVIVLALTHPKPGLPRVMQALAGDTRLIEDPLAPGALDDVGPGGHVAIIGLGLTSADIVATLKHRGFAGQITVLSRHGRRSMPHAPKQGESASDFTASPVRSALGLLRRVRAGLAADRLAGLTWHAVFDRLRSQGSAIWAALPQPERRRLLRHLRGLWDVHRFRIAPQSARAIEDMRSNGQLTDLAGQIRAVAPLAAAVSLTLKRRHSALVTTLTLDHVILATGPDHANIIANTPVLASLAALGLIRPDETRLGIATEINGLASGNPDPSVYIAGPLARGTVGELMGLPEVVIWSEHIARELIARLSASPQTALN